MELSQSGKNFLFEHGFELTRRAGQQEKVWRKFAILKRERGQIEPWSCAAAVGENLSLLRALSLAQYSVCETYAAFFEALDNALFNRGIGVQFQTEKLCGDVAGKVVGGRS